MNRSSNFESNLDYLQWLRKNIQNYHNNIKQSINAIEKSHSHTKSSVNLSTTTKTRAKNLSINQTPSSKFKPSQPKGAHERSRSQSTVKLLNTINIEKQHYQPKKANTAAKSQTESKLKKLVSPAKAEKNITTTRQVNMSGKFKTLKY